MTQRKVILYKALTSSLLSKIVSFIYQIISLPLLLSMLGVRNFGILAMMMASIGWVNILSGGVSPYVTKVVSENSPLADQKMAIAVTRTMILFGSLVLSIVFFFSIFVSSSLSDLKPSLSLLFLLSIFTINFSIAESIRQGKKEQHINNLYMVFANTSIIIGIYIAHSITSSSEYLLVLAIFVLYAPLLASKIINFYTLNKEFFSQGWMLPWHENRSLYKEILNFMLANLLIQLSVVLIKSCAVIYLGFENKIAAAKMEVVFRYLLISGTFFAAIQLPLWPLITEANKNKEKAWIHKTKVWLGLGFFSYGLLNFAIMYFFGRLIFDNWLGDQIYMNHTEIVSSATYFLIISLVQAPVILLMGFGAFRYLGKTFIYESLAFVLVIVLAFFLNITLSLSILVLSMALLRLVVFILLIKKAYLQ